MDDLDDFQHNYVTPSIIQVLLLRHCNYSLIWFMAWIILKKCNENPGYLCYTLGLITLHPSGWSFMVLVFGIPAAIVEEGAVLQGW